MVLEKSAQKLTRDKILDVARRHFAQRGFRKACLSEIAAELGVVKGALYYHLPGGKRELLEAVMAREDKRIFAAMQDAVAAEPDPRRALTAAVEAKVRTLRELSELLGIRREVGEEIAALLFARDRDFSRSERALFDEVLGRGEAAGVFRRVEPRSAAASAIQVLLQSLEVDEVFDGGHGSSRQLDTVLDLVLLGLLRR